MVQPIDVTQIMICLLTILGGALTVWLNGKRLGTGEARLAAAERRVSDHVELAASSARSAQVHAETVVRVTSMFPRSPAVPTIQGLAADAFESHGPTTLQSLPADALVSDPPPPAPPRATPPADRRTPRDPNKNR